MNFQEAIQLNNLGDMIVAQFGLPGFTEEAAKLHRQIAEIESISPELLAVTHLCEYSLRLADLKPNVNHQPSSPWSFDVGPFQLNVGWTMRMVWERQINTYGLLWKEVFGGFYEVDGVTPCAFNGNLLTHGRAAARRLLVTKGSDKDRAISFTSPGLAQQHRAQNWDKYADLFRHFFANYTG